MESRRRFPPFASLLGLLLAGAAALAPLPDRLTTSPVMQRGFDALHLPLFGLAAAVLFALLPVGMAQGRRLLIVLVVGVVTAAGVELIQPFTGRSASLSDFFYGVMGVVLALWFLTRRQPQPMPARIALIGATLLAVFVVGWPIVAARRHVVELAKSFPQLLVDDAATSAAFWTGQGGAELVFKTSENDALRVAVVTQPGEWSGVHFHPGIQDWSQKTTLVMQLSADYKQPFALGLRIDDKDSKDHATRFKQSVELGHEKRTIRIATADLTAASLDLSRISHLVLFVDPAESKRTFVIERAFLE